MVFLVLGFIAACDQNVEITPLATKSPPTPPPTQTTDYHLRIEFKSTSGWADLKVLNPDHILSVDLESVIGNPSNYDVTPEGLLVDQPFTAAENGDIVGLIVDYVIDPAAIGQPLNFQLLRGELNGCFARIYRLVGEEAHLILEVENQGEIFTDDKNTLAFSLNLTTMAEVASVSPTPKSTAPPSDAASIIFHNGNVLTIDDHNRVFDSLAIKDDQILAVGSNKDVLAYRGAHTVVIDLKGRTLIPGFADGHNHFFSNRPGSLAEAQDFAFMHGFTSMTEMAGDENYIAELMDAEDSGELRIRVNVFPIYNFGVLTDEGELWYAWQWYPENGPILGHNRMLRIPGIKVFSDGANVGQRGCFAMREPYSQEHQQEDWFKNICFSEYGDLYFDQAELNEIVADAQAAGFRVAFHTAGDRAIESVLNAIEYALNGQPNDDYRHQIQHSGFLEDDLIPRYQNLDVITSIRGHFHSCNSYGFSWEIRTNKYKLPGLGVHAYLETDFNWQRTTYRTLDPFVNMWSLVTRKEIEENGNICDASLGIPTDVISIEQALRMMTIEPAYAVSQDDYLGSLEPGKFADIVILAENPLTLQADDLMNNEVLMTMVGGNTEYCKPGQEVYCP
jgi:predicted amidohydrolase YtcJ